MKKDDKKGIKSLGFAKKKTKEKNQKSVPAMTGFEADFFEFWEHLGFMNPRSFTSKTHQKNIKILHKLLAGSYNWLNAITIEELKRICYAWRSYLDTPAPKLGNVDPYKMYFCDFVEPFKGYSFFRQLVEGKLTYRDLTAEEKVVAKMVTRRILLYTKQGEFSDAEKERIDEYAKYIYHFFQANQHIIAHGVGIQDIIKAVFKNIHDFLVSKNAPDSVWTFTGDYSRGSVLAQVMKDREFLKVYSSYEEREDIMRRKNEHIIKQALSSSVLQEPKPEIAKARLQELERKGVKLEQIDKSDCSRKEKYLKKKSQKKVTKFQGYTPFELPEGCYKEH